MRRSGGVAAASLVITDPFVKYQALVATGVYTSDVAQYRLAYHLQTLYANLKDYTPAPEYRARLRQVTESINAAQREVREDLAVDGHPIRRNPLFARFFRRTEGEDTLALTKVLTSYQEALHVDSPKGLFLSGEVGTGKSMLLDLLADGLPSSRKRRWHFNTFMLYIFSRLEKFRRSSPELATDGQLYSLMWLAKELVEESPILFLDEFQLPDRAASKILNSLFIAFFQLGGVLIASSNRMPEELEKALGAHYSPPATGGLVKQVLGLAGPRLRGELYGRTSDFAVFLDVMKARCNFWHMEGTRDWRKERGRSTILTDAGSLEQPSTSATLAGTRLQDDGAVRAADEKRSEPETAGKPAMYFTPKDESDAWREAVVNCSKGADPSSSLWQPANLVVYRRNIAITKEYQGVTYWNFSDIVQPFGPADYITLAANFHTFIIDNVPILTYSMKNEARRFITFLDAIYEARCKLLVNAEADPDSLFFPEAREAPPADGEQPKAHEGESDDATYSETIAEVFQDQTSPFRPNISTYTDSPNAKYDPDQDSDFVVEHKREVNFANTSAFTGEDERFAYRRAASRLWELCSEQWHGRHGDWWNPLPAEARHWEGNEPSKPLNQQQAMTAKSEITLGPSTEVAEPVGLERFRLAHLKQKLDE